MVNYEMMINAINNLGEDVFHYEHNGVINVVLNNFIGFDEDWDELYRDFDDEEAVDAFLKMLGTECVSHEGGFNPVYHFEGFDVEVSCASDDI